VETSDGNPLEALVRTYAEPHSGLLYVYLHNSAGLPRGDIMLIELGTPAVHGGLR